MGTSEQHESICVQSYITYSCGHMEIGPFVQCKYHEKQGTDKKCMSKQVAREEIKISTHRCRTCLKSDTQKLK